MSTISLPLSLPVKINSQNTNISFVQTEEGYFMNLDLKVEVPLKDLIDSLMTCGDKAREELVSLTQQAQRAVAATPEPTASPAVSPVKPVASDSDSTASERPSYCSVPFPRIDSPFRTKGRWRSNSATYFLREHKSPAPQLIKRQLSPNAPVFTPLSLSVNQMPAPSPFTQCSLAASDHGVWELPGLPSPLVEASPEPCLFDTAPAPPMMGQSILQRGLSNQCKPM